MTRNPGPDVAQLAVGGAMLFFGYLFGKDQGWWKGLGQKTATDTPAAPKPAAPNGSQNASGGKFGDPQNFVAPAGTDSSGKTLYVVYVHGVNIGTWNDIVNAQNAYNAHGGPGA